MEKDIKDRLTRDFGAKAEDAIALLNEFETQTDLGPRVSRCIVRLASGDTEKLKKSIKDARTDWRDVIVDAETTDFEFNKPFNS